MTFVSHVLPPALGYFIAAVLAVTPHTHAFRVALCPVVALLALRAVVSVDMSVGEPDQKSRNILLLFSMIFIVTRTLDWTLAKEPLVRHLRPGKSSKSRIMDAVDLASTFRGYGWDWSREVYFPPETRPTNRTEFTFYVFLSAVLHTLVSGVLYSAIWSFSPTGFGSPAGGSIFDDTLPVNVRYLRSSIISTFAAFEVYASMQAGYDACTIIGVLVFRQDPAEWPPAFDAPWRATSLNDFWGRRWHQFHRRMLLVQGGFPLSLVLGRVGLVVGTFLASGAFHHFGGMVPLNDQSEAWRTMVSFGMMAPGVLAERAFKRLTGRKVGGVVGWVWTMTWVILWGDFMIDACARAGVFGHFNVAESAVPGQAVVSRLVTDFDAWLHAI